MIYWTFQSLLQCKVILLNSETCNHRNGQVDFYSALDEDFRLLIWVLRERRISSWGSSFSGQSSELSADCSTGSWAASSANSLFSSSSFSFADLNWRYFQRVKKQLTLPRRGSTSQHKLSWRVYSQRVVCSLSKCSSRAKKWSCKRARLRFALQEASQTRSQNSQTSSKVLRLPSMLFCNNISLLIGHFPRKG